MAYRRAARRGAVQSPVAADSTAVAIRVSRQTLWRVLRAALLVAVLLAALAHAVGIWPIGMISQIELAIADARLRALMPRTLDPRVVIVDVDEKSLAEIGRWPWGRDQLASLSDELFARQKVAVVGFDMLFAEPDISSGLPALERLAAEIPSLAVHLAAWRKNLDQDARFARALTDRNAVLGFYLTTDRGARQVGALPAPMFDANVLQGRRINVTRADGYAANLPLLARAAPIAGYFNNVSDADGVVRRVSLVTELGGRLYEPLALAMLRRYTGMPAVEPRFSTGLWLADGYTALQGIELQQGTQRLGIRVDAHARVHVPFRGPGGGERRLVQICFRQRSAERAHTCSPPGRQTGACGQYSARHLRPTLHASG